MRLDKFLKVSRLIKRRTLAKEVADQGRVTINGNQAKAGTNVAKSDKIAIRFGQKLVTIKVNDVKETIRKNEAEMLYEVISEENIKE
ncbi:MAG TPA: RNA-binding S4 domain-containing protein [Candidatus Avamphibacillus sp.]|nr:RNA-binding S4 domain-containing protein [Candidatus Avamphibacillus sp.]